MPDAAQSKAMTYADSGVDYEALDAFKIACQREAATTVSLLASHHMAEAPGTRGESAYLVDMGNGTFLAHVEEGLGTKNLVADGLQRAGGPCLYRNIGIDTVATIVNDLITVGCLPAIVAMHAAVGDSAWFNDTHRAGELAAGFAEGCQRAGAVWGGGETPALAGIVEKNAIVLAGSAVGTMPAQHRVQGDVEVGDVMVFLASTGVQTNGLSLCRKIADNLPQGYLTPLPDGTTYGEALLAPSAIYADFVGKLREFEVRPKYLAHVTGHGWRKLMRLDKPLVYRVTEPGTPPPVFDFIARHGPVEQREMYATFNMGVGFVAYVSLADAHKTVQAATAVGHRAWIGGEVVGVVGVVGEVGVVGVASEDRKAVEVPALGITFEANELKLR